MNAILWPFVIDVRVRDRTRDSRAIRIWFPFFILWPLLFVLVAFVVLVTALVDIALWLLGARYHRYTLLVLSSMALLSQTRGTHAHIDSNGSHVDVDIY
jgi:hypothetical protein